MKKDDLNWSNYVLLMRHAGFFDQHTINCIGQKITGLTVSDDGVRIELGGNILKIEDHGRSCCETRYATCDDDLSHFVGEILNGIRLGEASTGVDGAEYHEIQFLIIYTTGGYFTIANHNEHSGYYGGFSIRSFS
jgi:hypothetical protein